MSLIKYIPSQKLLICILAIPALLVGSGCGGSGGGGGGGGGGNSNNNINLNDNLVDNINDNDGDDELQVQIDGLPAVATPVGEIITIGAVVFGGSGSYDYSWSLDNPLLAAIDDQSNDEVLLTLLADGQLQVSVVVTDQISGVQGQSAGLVLIGFDSGEPPAEAAIQILDLAPIEPDNQLVTLTAITNGPDPVSITWSTDPVNPLPPDALFFEDLSPDDNYATFYASTLLNFTYDLVFTATATYSNGSTLSDSTTVTIFGGP
ncbi:MAG: hypothetical protein HJJLKODD_02591 [Phycisphaerae bacterium]|nr:hypothetical protein [Phycisphaerae bacterium]